MVATPKDAQLALRQAVRHYSQVQRLCPRRAIGDTLEAAQIGGERDV